MKLPLPTASFVVLNGEIKLGLDWTLEKPETASRRNKRYHFRKTNGLCVKCGVELSKDAESVLCDKHRQSATEIRNRYRDKNPEARAREILKNREWRQQNPEENRKRQKKSRANRVKLGGCHSCGKPQKPGFTRCEAHLEMDRLRAKEYLIRKKLRLEQ